MSNINLNFEDPREEPQKKAPEAKPKFPERAYKRPATKVAATKVAATKVPSSVVKKHQAHQTKPPNPLPALESDNERAMAISEYLLRHKLVPSSFETREEVFMAVQLCYSYGFKVFGDIIKAIKDIYIFNGTIQIFGDLPISIVRASGQLEYNKEYFVDSEFQEICVANKNINSLPEAAVCEIKRKNTPKQEFIVTKKDLELSGGTLNDNGSWTFYKKKDKISQTWRKYPKVHWKNRVRNLALRSVFADILKSVKVGSSLDGEVQKKQSGLLTTYKTEA